MRKPVTQAFILGAGFGTRLRPLTENMPKVMVPIAEGKPLLAHSIELLRGQGIRDIIVNLHYLPEMITSYFGDGRKFGVNIAYSDETERLMDTGGALKKAASMLDDDFILMYGDELHFLDFGPVIDRHRAVDALGTVVLKTSEIPQNGDLAEFDAATGLIVRWHTRPHGITAYREGLANNAGLYVLSKRIVDYIPDGPVKLDGVVIPRAMEAGEPFAAYPIDEPVLDVGDSERYDAAKTYYREQTAKRSATRI